MIFQNLVLFLSQVVVSKKVLHHELPGWRKDLLPEEEVQLFGSCCPKPKFSYFMTS